LRPLSLSPLHTPGIELIDRGGVVLSEGSTMSETSSSFSALGVPAPLVAVLSAQGIETPFPIQVDTLPDTLSGRDVLGRGKTGSGKTLAFAIPMIDP
jgi:superfamily II DNA/RNA helicase